MVWKAAVPILMGGVVVACTQREAPPEPTNPTFSIEGAQGIAADVRRVVTELDGDVETTVSVVDTAVWAPFDENGAALVTDDEAGMVGPIGLLTRQEFASTEWQRYGSFVDSTGVLHEIRVGAKHGGPWRWMEYQRGGRVVLNLEANWMAVTGGWVMDQQTVTYHLEHAPAVRVALEGRQLDVASAGLGTELLAQAAGGLEALLLPRPLAAQFYFGACSGDWLKWIGTAVLAELAWARFIAARSFRAFKTAVAATAAAGVAFSGLMDCMLEQAEQPDPGA
jgi:hypothetical protein